MHPAEVGVNVGEVLGQCGPLVYVRVAPVKQVEFCLAVLDKEVNQVGGVGVGNDVLVPFLEAGVYLEGQSRLDSRPYYLVHHIVLERFGLKPRDALAQVPGNPVEGHLGLVPGYLVVLQGAVIGQAALDTHHAAGHVFFQGHPHRPDQVVQGVYRRSRFFFQGDKVPPGLRDDEMVQAHYRGKQLPVHIGDLRVEDGHGDIGLFLHDVAVPAGPP